MNNNNYINIQGFMINELGLKGNELILYAIIYGFSQDGHSEYYGSQRYISKAMGISVVSANHLINKLLDKGLIIKTTESHYKVLKNLKQGVKESLTVSVKESLTNNNNTNNKDNNKYPKEYLLNISDKDIEEFTNQYNCTGDQVIEMAEKILLYCESKGKTYKNYRSTLQSWLLNQYKKRNKPTQKYKYVQDQINGLMKKIKL